MRHSIAKLLGFFTIAIVLSACGQGSELLTLSGGSEVGNPPEPKRAVMGVLIADASANCPADRIVATNAQGQVLLADVNYGCEFILALPTDHSYAVNFFLSGQHVATLMLQDGSSFLYIPEGTQPIDLGAIDISIIDGEGVATPESEETVELVVEEPPQQMQRETDEMESMGLDALADPVPANIKEGLEEAFNDPLTVESVLGIYEQGITEGPDCPESTVTFELSQNDDGKLVVEQSLGESTTVVYEGDFKAEQDFVVRVKPAVRSLPQTSELLRKPLDVKTLQWDNAALTRKRIETTGLTVERATERRLRNLFNPEPIIPFSDQMRTYIREETTPASPLASQQICWVSVDGLTQGRLLLSCQNWFISTCDYQNYALQE